MKRLFIILTPLLLGILAFAAVLEYFHPQMEAFVVREMRSISGQFTPFEISSEQVHFRFLPPRLDFESMQIAAKSPKDVGFDIIDIDLVEAHLDILQLLVGRVGISTLSIHSPEVELDLDAFTASAPTTPSTSSEGLNLNPLFEQLKIIPIHKIELSDIDAHLVSQKLNLNFKTDQSNLLIVNTGTAIQLEADLDVANFKFRQISDSAHLRLGATLNKNQLEVSKFHFTTEEIDVIFSAQIKNLRELRKNLQIESKYIVNINLNKASEKLKSEVNFPELEGSLKLSGSLSMENNELENAELDLSAMNLVLSQMTVGKLDSSGSWKDNHYVSKYFQITSEAAIIDLHPLELDVRWKESKPEVSLKSRITSDMIDLNQLLHNLGVKQIPIEMLATNDLTCTGPIFPEPMVQCSGDIHTDMFEARSDFDSKDSIVQLPEVEIHGGLTLDKEKVTYQADLKIDDNNGHSEGRVTFAEGFNISYSTPQLDFKNIDNLANLKLEGRAKLSGRTTGDSNHAVFFIDFEGEDIWFENFFLGYPKTTLRYEDGLLSFENITSTVNGSHIGGEVDVYLREQQISVNGESHGMEIADLLAVFQRKFTLPVDAAGNADFKVSAEGPFDFSHLSYQFAADLQKGNIAGESFDHLSVKINSEKGEVKIQEFDMQKGQGHLKAQGVAHPDGTTQLSMETQGMALEECDNVARLSPNISGKWAADLKMTGKILNPEIELNANISKMIIEEQEIAPSEVHLNFSSHGVRGHGNLFSGALKSDFLLPFSNEDPFRLEMSARNWNFTTIFTLIGGGPILSEYQASLTGDLNLHSEKGGFFAASGEATILRAELQRKNLKMINPGPMSLTMDNGKMSLNNFRVSGEDSFVEVSTAASTRNNLNLKIRSHMQLRLLQIFMPFMDELSGETKFQAVISGNIDKPEILGDASLQNGFIKLKSLPHAFERASLEAQFSQTRVIVSEIKSGFAGGTLTGEGNITLKGMHDLPMQFKAEFENVSLNIPDQIHTGGHGNVTLSGNWFPFLLAGTYHITSGSVTKEFTDSALERDSKQSSYLPKILLRSAFEPLQLNLQLLLEQSLPVKNSLMEGNVSGNMLVQGTPGSPILTGKIELEPSSKISFRDKVFDVSNGRVSFQDTKEINPDFFISAQSHVADYDVFLTVQGNAKTPVIQLTSLPPLQYQDIVSLLALGITTGNLDDNGGLQRRESNSAATQAAAATFNQISRDAQKALDFNFQASSQYDDTKNMAIQKYTISRKVTDKITLYGSQTKGDLESQALQFKYRLNSNFSISTSFENVESAQSGTSTQTEPIGQILGIDLEYKQEFR